MDRRVAHHLVRRLRHRARADAITQAIARGILIAEHRTVAGAEVRVFAPGPAVAGRSEAAIARLIRHGPRARSTAAREANHDAFPGPLEDLFVPVDQSRQGFPSGTDLVRADDLPDITSLLRTVRTAAGPLQAAEVATVLLIAQSITLSATSLDQVLEALRVKSPIITITGRVKGFEEVFLDLLRRGLILPGKVATCKGYDLSQFSYGFRFADANDGRWRVITFEGEGFSPDTPIKMEQQVAIAARSSHPILGVTESEGDLPQQLKQATGLNLVCGPLGMEIIHETMRAVLGEVSEGGISWRHSQALTLPDLALAIRPGQSVGRALDLLEELARARLAAVEQESSEDEDGSGKGSGRKSSSTTTASKSKRGDPSSGCERIEPALLTDTDTDRFIPRVETLSGYGEARDWALGLKDDLALWRAGTLQWDDMSVKLLLSGPPGTGKTTFARALCNTLQIPLFATSVATWLEPGYLGDVLLRMTASFAEAEAASPAILFLDEIDGIGRRSSGRDWSDYWNTVVNRALELLDGAARSTGVIVIGATNRPAMLDPALIRSGRLEKHIVIPPPTTDALTGILEHHLGNDLAAVVASAPPDLSRSIEATEVAEPDQPRSTQSPTGTASTEVSGHGEV